MDRRLLDALGRHPAVHDWTVRRQRGRSAQIYLVGNVVENVRQVEREAYEVEVFNDHTADGEPVRGSATVPMSRDDLDRLADVLDTASVMASLVHNPPWSLPAPGEPLPDVELADPRVTTVDGSLSAVHEVADTIRARAAAEASNGVRLSAAELFVNTIEEELHNSRGLVAEATSTHLLLQVALLARLGDEEAEYFREAEARRLIDLRIEETIEEGSRMARDKLGAEAPRTRVGPVVIGGEALPQLFGGTAVSQVGALLIQASASTAYSKLSRLEVDQPIYGDRPLAGDPLTLRANARLPFGVGSYRFDGDGVPAHDLLVVEDGVLRARPATQRYAQYLGLPVTGRPGMAQVGAGAVKQAGLLEDGPVCQVVAFSAPNVDALTGDFGMEIRLGYEYGSGDPRPITGGSVTGNLFEAFANVTMAAETRVYTWYAGPVAMRFGSLQVAGRD
jgi:predicted Zn-dependent protease